MDTVIRADASVRLGSGHVMRCLTLAGLLRSAGVEVSFAAREMPATLERLISENYVLHRLTNPPRIADSAVCEECGVETIRYLQNRATPDWLIIDHYALDLDWQTKIRPYVRKIMVIDDLANRRHDCDLLLDQNLCPHLETRYDGLVPKAARKLLGPKYALLRPEFYHARESVRIREGAIKSILVSFGGADPTNETGKALQAMSLLSASNLELEVVVGGSNPHADKISNLCSNLPHAHFHRDAENMAELMAKADLAIGAPGATTWERCFLGLPTIAIVLAQNQQLVGAAVTTNGAMINLGWHSEVTPDNIAEAVAELCAHPQVLCQMSQAALRIMEQNEDVARGEILRAILYG